MERGLTFHKCKTTWIQFKEFNIQLGWIFTRIWFLEIYGGSRVTQRAFRTFEVRELAEFTAVTLGGDPSIRTRLTVRPHVDFTCSRLGGAPDQNTRINHLYLEVINSTF